MSLTLFVAKFYGLSMRLARPSTNIVMMAVGGRLLGVSRWRREVVSADIDPYVLRKIRIFLRRERRRGIDKYFMPTSNISAYSV